MDKQIMPTLEERVARLEIEVNTLNAHIATLMGHAEASTTPALPVSLSAVSAVGNAPVAVNVQPDAALPVETFPPPTKPLHEVYCPTCRGGNPPGVSTCIWCGNSMRARVAPAQPMAPAPAPRARVDISPTPAAIPSGPSAQQPRDATRPARQPVQQRIPVPPAPRKPFNVTVWLSRIGIFLFLLGVAFLFKYSYDQGWIDAFFNYQVRVIIGITLGSVLLYLGMRLGKEHRNLSQVLMGGSIATFYITAYAASILFNIASADTSCVFMLSVTALAFILAVNQNHMSLAIIGVAGGLATPFLLYSLSVDLAWLVAYTCCILAGSSAIYLFKGWRTLFWVSFVGGCGSLSIAQATSRSLTGSMPDGVTLALQAGIIACTLAFWAVPVLREVLCEMNPRRWARQPLPMYLMPAGSRDPEANAVSVDIFTACLLAVGVPLACFGLSAGLWPGVSNEVWGLVALAGAALLGFIGWSLRQISPRLAYTHAATAVIFLTTFLGFEFAGDILLLAFAIEGTALHLVARRYEDRGSRLGGHILFAVAALWLGARLAPFNYSTPDITPVLNAQALTDLAVIALALLASTLNRHREEKLVYRGLAYMILLPWLAREIHTWDFRYLMVTWAVYAVALHFLARQRDDSAASAVGHLSFVLTGLLFGVALLMQGLLSGRDIPFVTPHALAALLVIVLAAVSSFIIRPTMAVTIYRVAVHAAVLGWLAVQALELAWPAHYTLLFWMAYGTALMLVGRRVPDVVTSFTGQVIVTGAGALLLMQTAVNLVLTNSYQTPIFNWRGLSDLGVLALGVVVWRLLIREKYALAYGLGLYVAFGAWLWQELGMIPPDTVGNAVASMAWGVYAVVLLAVGIWKDRDRTLIYMGVGMLFATATKLLLVDLRFVDAFWRILLFLGFGALFLATAYYLEKVMLPHAAPANPVESEAAEAEPAGVESGDLSPKGPRRVRISR